MRLDCNLFILGLLIVFVSADYGKDDGFQKQNVSSENNPVIVEPRIAEITTIEPIQFEIQPNLEDSFSEISTRGITAVCNGAAISLEGTSSSNPVLIQSNNYPNKYPNNERCAYNFKVPANRKIYFKIKSMEIECPYDDIQISLISDPPVLNLCSLASSQAFTMSPLPFECSLKVLFTSDDTITFRGFQINVWVNSSTTTTTTTKKPTAATAQTTPLPPGTCTCGRWSTARNNDEVGRIVGGSVAAPHSIPYQIGLWTQRSANPLCGGTLISPLYVLTAAHCLTEYKAEDLRITVNDVNYYVKGDGEKFINVSSMISHPLYNQARPDDNDFALLRLATPAPISSTVGIACLPPDVTQTFAGTNMTISGWGRTSGGGVQSHDLKVSYVTGWTNDACEEPYGIITENMICAASTNFETDTCQGDSGGPMVTTIDNRVTLVGVTSVGRGCAQSPFPGIYARVTAQISWILANSDAGACQN